MVNKPSLLLNWLLAWDPSHGACRDLTLSYQDVDQSHTVVFSLVVLNLRSGPDKEEGMRHEQLRDMSRKVFERFSHNTCALFQARLPEMTPELRRTVREKPCETWDEASWRTLKEENDTEPKGSRIKMCQWMGWITGMRGFLEVWFKEKFKREFLALEHDFFASLYFCKKGRGASGRVGPRRRGDHDWR